MNQIEKRYKFHDGNYTEWIDNETSGDVSNYPILGYQWTDGSILRRNLYYSQLDYLKTPVSMIVSAYQLYDPVLSKWVDAEPEMTHRAAMDGYVYQATGQYEPNPFEDDLDHELLDPQGNPTGTYQQKLKAGLIPEFKFFYSLQYTLYLNTCRNIQANKHGATSFS